MPLSKDLDKLNSTALEMLTGELPGLPPTLSFRALLGVKDADPRAVDCNRGRGLVNLLLRNELQGYSTSLMPKHPKTIQHLAAEEELNWTPIELHYMY